MISLGIETSCDETSVGIVDNGEIIVNLVYTQKFHREFGGVVPEIASRAHLQKLLPLLKKALTQSNLSFTDIDVISATAGPGLIGALIVGYCFGRAACYSTKKPFIPVNHIDGHLYSVFLSQTKPTFPYISLLVSGGNTALYLIDDFYKVKLLGSTVDDAAGEAFDKVGKLLGMNYPAGTEVENAASLGDEHFVSFPISSLSEKFNFSFSGIKTSVLRFIQKEFPNGLNKNDINNIAASFQKAVVTALVDKLALAVSEYKVKNLAVVGGVAANTYLKKKIKEKFDPTEFTISIPDLELCTDNGAMIAYAGLKSFETKALELNLITEPFPN